MILFLKLVSFFSLLGDFSTFFGGVFPKKNNTLTTIPSAIPNPIDSPNPNPIPIHRPNPSRFFIILHLPGFEFQTSAFEVHLHLHYATQANIANLLIFVGLISFWSQTHSSPLTESDLV